MKLFKLIFNLTEHRHNILLLIKHTFNQLMNDHFCSSEWFPNLVLAPES